MRDRFFDLAALRLMRFMSDFREAMWGVLQSGISELDFDFRGYAAKHFDRLERTSSEPAFDRYLRNVGARLSGPARKRSPTSPLDGAVN